MYYAFIQDDKINGKGQCYCTSEQVTCVEIEEEVYNDLDRYMAVKHEEEVEVPEYEAQEVPLLDENNEPVLDENDEPVMTTEEVQVGSHIEEQVYYTIELNPDYDEEQLALAKEAKYTEANLKAFEYLEGGNAVYTYEEGKSIEATDGNIAKLGLALVNFILTQDYTSTIEWNTKENENVQLNAEQLQVIVAGLQQIQSVVWTIKFPEYNLAISEAETIEEVNAIEINYGE